MSNTRSSTSLLLLERAVASLDAEVLGVLNSLGFSDSPQRWNDELAKVFTDRYRSRVADVKERIRTVAQEFRGSGWTEQLIREGQELLLRKDMLRSMLAALDVLTSREFHPPGIQPDRLDRLQESVPTFRATIGAISVQTSRWRDDLREWEDVFNTLEKPVATIGLLLHFVPATVPDAHVTEAREVIETLVALWTCRRQVLSDANRLIGTEEPEDPICLMGSLDEQHDDHPFSLNHLLDIVNRLDNLPPLYLPIRNFAASEFLEAEAAFKRLRSEYDSIIQDISRLECIFDHFMGIIDAHALEFA